jgi:hypothetical protein
MPNAAIEAFAAAVQAKHMDTYYGVGTVLPTPTISVEYGPKYARIVKNDMGRSVYCFVEIATGNILKAAGWKSPAKHARGNVNTPTHGVEYVGPYGPAYLR